MRPLLIFDLDETLVHATEIELARPADFNVSPYFVYLRPHHTALLEFAAKHYDLAVWSSSSRRYVDAIVREIFGDRYPLRFSWSVERCVQKVDVQADSYVYIKDLRKVQGQGYALEQITILDDSPEKICRQPRNHLYVKPFLGALDDIALLEIAEILRQRATCG